MTAVTNLKMTLRHGGTEGPRVQGNLSARLGPCPYNPPSAITASCYVEHAHEKRAVSAAPPYRDGRARGHRAAARAAGGRRGVKHGGPGGAGRGRARGRTVPSRDILLQTRRAELEPRANAVVFREFPLTFDTNLTSRFKFDGPSDVVV